nr:hypothetical protein [Thioalkalivibrio sp. HK1]
MGQSHLFEQFTDGAVYLATGDFIAAILAIALEAAALIEVEQGSSDQILGLESFGYSRCQQRLAEPVSTASDIGKDRLCGFGEQPSPQFDGIDFLHLPCFLRIPWRKQTHLSHLIHQVGLTLQKAIATTAHLPGLPAIRRERRFGLRLATVGENPRARGQNGARRIVLIQFDHRPAEGIGAHIQAQSIFDRVFCFHRFISNRIYEEHV